MSQISHSFNRVGVIVGCDLVGDALLKLPFLRALRNAFPKADIHWIASHGSTFYAGALREPTRTFINNVHEQPAWLPTADRPEADISAAPSFDLLIDTRNRWKEAVQARKLPHKLFVAPATRFLFSDKRPNLFKLRPAHMVDRMLQTLEIVTGAPTVTTGALSIPANLKDKARRILPAGKTYIGFATGAGNKEKIWPRANYERLAAAQTVKGRVPVFLLGPAEQNDHGVLAKTFPNAIFPLQDLRAWDAPKLGIEHTLAIASLLNAAVANDSGVGHMLAAADCRLISLFGPTIPKKLAPRVSQGKVIRAQDFGSAQMNVIPVDVVDRAVDEILSSS